MYLKVFECTWMYWNVFRVYLNVLIVYLWYISMCLKYIQCIYSMFQCISMCLNVFIDIVIGILSWHSHCNVFAMYTHLHIFFSPSPICYTTTLLFFHSHWSVPTFIQSMKELHINFYFTSIHHLTFHIPCCHWLHGA
jgi:hypothetical protein